MTIIRNIPLRVQPRELHKLSYEEMGVREAAGAAPALAGGAVG